MVFIFHSSSFPPERLGFDDENDRGYDDSSAYQPENYNFGKNTFSDRNDYFHDPRNFPDEDQQSYITENHDQFANVLRQYRWYQLLSCLHSRNTWYRSRQALHSHL